jgi:DNA-binding CsgD family transcriptional regulator
VLSSRGDLAAGRQLLERSLELALQLGQHEHVGRAYHNYGNLGLPNREYRRSDQILKIGLAYCDEHDLDAFGNHIVMGLARSAAEQGRYADVDDYLELSRRRPHLSHMTSMAYNHIAGQVAARRDGDVGGLLDEAWRRGEPTGEAQQVVPNIEARAERAWILGRPDEVVTEVDRAWPYAVAQGNPWEVGELCWWLFLAGARREPPVPISAPNEAMLQGRWREAADAWEEIGRRLWIAYALMLSPDPADGRRAVAVAEELGAHAARQAILRERQARGLSVPHGPRSTTRANPSGLTRRELEVLRLLAEGLSNPEIAAKLFLSERTVAHHVSAVLQKLGEPTRSRAVAAAVRRGIVVAG